MGDAESMVLAWSERDHVSQINGTEGKRELSKIHLRLRCRASDAKKADAEVLLGHLLWRRGDPLFDFSDDFNFYSCSWFLNFLGKVLANREIMFVMKSVSQTHIS